MSTYIITCGSCGTNNRIPAEMEGKKGRCGSCRAPLPPLYHRPQTMTDSSFDSFIATSPGPVLAEFWAPSWPHCISFAPAVRTVAERVAGKAVVVQINTRDNPALADRFAVRGIPVMMMLRGGKVIDKLAGAQTAEAVLAWFHRQR